MIPLRNQRSRRHSESDTSVFLHQFSTPSRPNSPTRPLRVSRSRQPSGERSALRVATPLWYFGLPESLLPNPMRTSPRLQSTWELTVLRPIPPRDVRHPPRRPAIPPPLTSHESSNFRVSPPSSRRVLFPLFFQRFPQLPYSSAASSRAFSTAQQPSITPPGHRYLPERVFTLSIQSSTDPSPSESYG